MVLCSPYARTIPAMLAVSSNLAERDAAGAERVHALRDDDDVTVCGIPAAPCR